MMTRTQIEATINQAVGIMVRYQAEKNWRLSRDRMTAEVQAIGGWVNQTGMGPLATDSLILKPISDRLLAVCGSEVGPRLFAEFLRAFYDLWDVSRVDLTTFSERPLQSVPAAVRT